MNTPGERLGRPSTFRIPEKQLRELEALAIIDGTSISDVIRAAVSTYVELRLSDPDLHTKIETAQQRVIDTLSVFENPNH